MIRRSGSIHTAKLVFLGSILVFAVATVFLLWDPSKLFEKKEEPQPLVVYCAAGLQLPVEEIARDYERECGVQVQLQYGGSETLLANLEVSKQGDLYLPADTSYLDKGHDKGLIDEQLKVGDMHPVIVVKKGNPLKIQTVKDLLRDDVRLALANAKAAAVGKVTMKALDRELGEALEKKAVVTTGTVNEVANSVKVGTAHAGIVWNITAVQYPDLEAIEVPELAKAQSNVAMGVLRSTKQSPVALKFARYLTARDRGLLVFKKHGYNVEIEKNGEKVIDGDEWSENPEITIFAGTILRPAILDTVKEFEAREGIPHVNTKFAGCGILVGDMKTGSRPDLFIACDKQFLDHSVNKEADTKVRDLFIDEEVLSTDKLVILVRKGNPHNIKSLTDLTKDGLQVGVGHDQQCALGLLTRQAIEAPGRTDADRLKLHAAVTKNVVVTQPAGDLLIVEMRAKKSLDAVVTYLSNAVGREAEFDAIELQGPCSTAVQPLAVGMNTKYPHLTRRLVQRLHTEESKKRFTDNGFEWKAK